MTAKRIRGGAAAALMIAALLLSGCGKSADTPDGDPGDSLNVPEALDDQGPGASVSFMRPKGEVREIDFTIDEGTQLSVDISPDGRWIVFDLLGHVYRMPAEGGEAVSLTQGSGISLNFHPAYSPDGSKIVFISDRSGQNNVWVMNADGSEPRPVYLDPDSRFSDPAWHPDGDNIVAVRTFPSPGRGWHRRNMTLARLSLDTSRAEELLRDELAHFTAPSFSPDGHHLYFEVAYSTWGGNGLLKAGHRIQRLDMTSGERVNVRLDEPVEPTDAFLEALRSTTYAADVAGDEPAALNPEVSPDGRYLAFAVERPDTMLTYRGHEFRGHTGLAIRDLETSEERLLLGQASKDLTQANAQYSYRAFPGFSWAPDSSAILLAHGGKIRRIEVDDGWEQVIPFSARVHRVISGQVRSRMSIEDESFGVKFLRWPASSPDGDRLVFAAVGRLWVVDLPDGRPRPLLDGMADEVQLTPDWSGDGKSIVFATWNNTSGGHVWVVPAEGGEPRRVTSAAAQYLYPVFSPDGDKILVAKGPESLWPSFYAPRPSINAEATAGPAEWHLALVDTAGGEAETVLALDKPRRGTFLASGRFATHGQDDVAASFDLRSPFPNDAALAQVVRVRSYALDGGDPKEHAIFPPRLDFFGGTNAPVLSPDGTRVAFEAGRSVYVAELTSEAPVRIDPDPNVNVPGRTRIGDRGGAYPRWRTAGILEFMSGNEYVVYDLSRGESTTVTIELNVPRDVPRGKLALTNAKIITINGDEVIGNGDLVIDGARLACVGDCDMTGVDRVIDASGKVIIPGLVDVHAHHTVVPGNVVTQHVPAAALALAYGVTTIVDPATTSKSAFPLAEMIEAGVLAGPRTYSSAELVITQSYAWGDNLEITNVENATYNAGHRARWGAIQLKNYRLASRQHHQYLIEAARAHSITVTGEGGPLFADVGFAMDGQTGWEHFLGPLPIYRDAVLFLGKAGMHYSPTVIVAGHVNGAKDYFRQSAGLLEDAKYRRFMPADRLEAMHANVPDWPKSAFSFPIVAEGLADIIRAGGYGALGEHGEQYGIGTHWELWAYAEALTPLEALTVGSLHGAHFVGLDGETGSIEVGKLADLIVLDSDPLEDIRNTADIAYVVKAGNVYDDETLNRIWPDGRSFGQAPWLSETD